VLRARNEEENIGETVFSLKNQTKNLEIIVVNDGSVDKTGEIVRQLGCLVIELPDRGYNAVGRPELANVINVGFRSFHKIRPEYVLCVDADHSLPKDYVELLLKEMKNDEQLVVASGYILGEPYNSDMPRDSGRIYLWRFLEEIGFLPNQWGWGAYPLFKALSMGYRSQCFQHIRSSVKRRTSTSNKKMYFLGKSMMSLGYWWLYALGRCTINKSLWMLLGYFSRVEKHEKELRIFVKKWQKDNFIRKVLRILKHLGRK